MSVAPEHSDPEVLEKMKKPPVEHYEHRILERPAIDMAELNRFGRDGWQMVTAVQAGPVFKIVLVRRI